MAAVGLDRRALRHGRSVRLHSSVSPCDPVPSAPSASSRWHNDSMKRPRKAVRVGVPILVIGLLALAALWRVGAPADARRTGTATDGRPSALEPLTNITDVAAGTRSEEHTS